MMVLTLLVGTGIASIEGTALALPPHEPSTTLPSSVATPKSMVAFALPSLPSSRCHLCRIRLVPRDSISSPKSNVSFSTPAPSSPSSSKALPLTALSRIPVTPPAAPSLKSSVSFSTLTCRHYHLQRCRLQSLCLMSQWFHLLLRRRNLRRNLVCRFWLMLLVATIFKGIAFTNSVSFCSRHHLPYQRSHLLVLHKYLMHRCRFHCFCLCIAALGRAGCIAWWCQGRRFRCCIAALPILSLSMVVAKLLLNP